MNEFFGTDGIRGIPGKHPLTPEFIEKIAYASACEITAGKTGWTAVIGRDSRASGERILEALAKGITAAGGSVVDMGIVPTPGVSHIVPKLSAAFGVVISASHNPPEFNGIKFFSQEGIKLDEGVERRIELALAGLVGVPQTAPRITRRPELAHEYVAFLASTFQKGQDLKGLRLVIDCANGAAYEIAGELFKKLGAEVFTIGCSPDGTNINDGIGALHTQKMRAEVVARKAACGFSLDGDADRVIFSDETGAELDGDDIIAMAALELKKAGRLKHDKVVLTVMSNLGLVDSLRERGIETVSVSVGDKNVSQALEKEDLSIGGEASGHIIMRDFAPTGDGLLTAVQVLGLLRLSGKPLSHFRQLWTRYPQVLKAIDVKKKTPLADIPGFNGFLKKLEERLGGKGRIFVRYSGTEPKLRVLVEGPRQAVIEAIAAEIITCYNKSAEGVSCQ